MWVEGTLVTFPVLSALVKVWQVWQGDQVSFWISSYGESWIHVTAHRLVADNALRSFHFLQVSSWYLKKWALLPSGTHPIGKVCKKKQKPREGYTGKKSLDMDHEAPPRAAGSRFCRNFWSLLVFPLNREEEMSFFFHFNIMESQFRGACSSFPA